MTPESHIATIIMQFAREATGGYLGGQREHGGQLWLKTGMLAQAKKEANDQISYLYTAEQQIPREAVRLATITGGDVAIIEAELRQWLLDTSEDAKG